MFWIVQNTFRQLLTPQKHHDGLFQCLVKQALKRASRYHREGIQWQPEKKCHHLCVNISHVGGQVYWHLDDHPGPFSPALIDCSSTYISQQQGPAHVSFVRKKEQSPRWHKNKDVWIPKPRGANTASQVMHVAEHNLQEGKWVPFGAALEGCVNKHFGYISHTAHKYPYGSLF